MSLADEGDGRCYRNAAIACPAKHSAVSSTASHCYLSRLSEDLNISGDLGRSISANYIILFAVTRRTDQLSAVMLRPTVFEMLPLANSISHAESFSPKAFAT